MSKRALEEKLLTIPEVKQILESISEAYLDQFQRRSLDYAMKFSKLSAERARELVKRLMENFNLEEAEAVQLVNCMPESIEEIRVFLAGGHKIVKTSELEGILALLDEYRERKEEE